VCARCRVKKSREEKKEDIISCPLPTAAQSIEELLGPVAADDARGGKKNIIIIVFGPATGRASTHRHTSSTIYKRFALAAGRTRIYIYLPAATGPIVLSYICGTYYIYIGILYVLLYIYIYIHSIRIRARTHA